MSVLLHFKFRIVLLVLLLLKPLQTSGYIFATAPFAKEMWGRDTFDDVDESSPTVKCTVYDIGGKVTKVSV